MRLPHSPREPGIGRLCRVPTVENGEPLVDNQLYRASGCNKLNRGTGPGTHQFLSPFLVELRRLDDLKNNDHVEMSIYSTEEGEAADGRRMFSFRVRMDGKFTGERLSHLNHRQFGISVLLNVLGQFPRISLTSGYRRNVVSYAQSTYLNRIRQKIDRIGKASKRRLPIAWN